nr:uncharacterized protein LOC109170919 [Ipomoea trifida]
MRRGCRRCIGDGLSTKIGSDPWLPIDDNPYICSPLHESVIEAPVSSLLNHQGTGWDVACVKDIFNERDANLILNIPISLRKPTNSWVWFKEPKGDYSVKSCYRMLVGEVHDNRPWCQLWKLKVPPKIDESAKHLFMECQHIASVWATMGIFSTLHGQGSQANPRDSQTHMGRARAVYLSARGLRGPARFDSPSWVVKCLDLRCLANIIH